MLRNLLDEMTRRRLLPIAAARRARRDHRAAAVPEGRARRRAQRRLGRSGRRRAGEAAGAGRPPARRDRRRRIPRPGEGQRPGSVQPAGGHPRRGRGGGAGHAASGSPSRRRRASRARRSVRRRSRPRSSSRTPTARCPTPQTEHRTPSNSHRRARSTHETVAVDIRFGPKNDTKIRRAIPRNKAFYIHGKLVAVFVKYSPSRKKAVFAVAPGLHISGPVKCRVEDGVCRYLDIPAGSHARLTMVTRQQGTSCSRRLDVVRIKRRAPRPSTQGDRRQRRAARQPACCASSWR